MLSLCLISRHKGLGTSLQLMGLATIDAHSQKVLTKLYKIHKFSVIGPNISKIQPFENVKIFTEMYGHLYAVSGRPNISL